MFLGKTGWRIKQLISHRKHPSIENGDVEFEDIEAAEVRAPPSRKRRLSWLSQNPLEPLLHRTNSDAATRTQPLPPVKLNAHSSNSSLCSCENVESLPSNSNSLSRVRSAPARPEQLCLPATSSNNINAAKAWQLLLSGSPSRSSGSRVLKIDANLSSTTTIVSGISSGDEEARRSIKEEHSDEEKTPTQSVHFFEDHPNLVKQSDHIERVAQKRSSLPESSSVHLYEAEPFPEGGYDTFSTTAIDCTIPLSQQSIMRRPLRSPFTPPKSPIVRSMSNSKSDKKKAIKKKTHLLDRAFNPVSVPPEQNDSSKGWTFSDVTTNVVDVFSGRRFRSEPAQRGFVSSVMKKSLQQINTESGQRDRNSVDSQRSDGTGESTPTEPFHLESLTPRVRTPQEDPPPLPTQIPTPPITPKTHPPKSGFRPKLDFRKIKYSSNVAITKISDKDMTIHDLTFPSPPRTPRRPSTSRSTHQLPTIPEISRLEPLPTTFLRLPAVLLSPSKTSILLPSTQKSFTCPFYLHGPIRLDRPKKAPKDSSPLTAGGNSEPLDWTAFQMAMLGTMDEGFSQPFETHEEYDDILAWYSEFGFHGWGEMTSPNPRTESSKRAPGPKIPFPSYQANPNPLPISERRPGRRGGRSGTPPLPLLQTTMALPSHLPLGNQRRPFSFEVGGGGNERESLSTTTATTTATSSSSSTTPPNQSSHHPQNQNQNQNQNHSSNPSSSRFPSPKSRTPDSLSSLPPSPMEILNLTFDVDGNGEVVPPMGTNLAHDLGDFLRWERENVGRFDGRFEGKGTGGWFG